MSPDIPTSSHPSAFGADVLTLVTGTTIAQIITILASPIITRLYGPETFGLFALFTSITSIIGVVACMRYELAIMLPESDEEAANVFGLCVIIVTIISTVTFLPLLVFQHVFLQLLKAPQLGPFFWLIPIMTWASGIFLALNFWNTRTKQFYRLSIARVMRSGISTGTQLSVGFLGYASGGALITASVIGQIAASLTLGAQIMRDSFSFFQRNISWNGMWIVLKRYNNFPKYDIWSALLNTISTMLPIFILTVYFNQTIVGYYAFGLLILQIPVNLIGGAISQVFFQKAAEAKRDSQKKLKEIVEKTLEPLIFLSVFPTLVLILIGPEIFSFVFGIRWYESGVYVRFLALWMSIVFLSSPISTLFSIFQKQQLTLAFNTAQMVLRIIALMIGAVMGNALVSIILFALVGSLTNIIALMYLLKLTDILFIFPIKVVFHEFLLCIPFILVIIALQFFFTPNIMIIVLASAGISLCYYLFTLKANANMLRIIKQTIH